jgi:hypothetical protein
MGKQQIRKKGNRERKTERKGKERNGREGRKEEQDLLRATNVVDI